MKQTSDFACNVMIAVMVIVINQTIGYAPNVVTALKSTLQPAVIYFIANYHFVCVAFFSTGNRQGFGCNYRARVQTLDVVVCYVRRKTGNKRLVSTGETRIFYVLF